jgi:hypothetical protein
LLLGVATALRGMGVAGDRDVARIAAGARDLIGAEAFASGFARGAALYPGGALTALTALTAPDGADGAASAGCR